MRLRNIEQSDAFEAAVAKCHGEVYLTSNNGDKYNLKSYLSRYIAMAELMHDHGADLELWCDERADEQHFFQFFAENPEVLDL